MTEWGLDTSTLQSDPELPTGTTYIYEKAADERAQAAKEDAVKAAYEAHNAAVRATIERLDGSYALAVVHRAHGLEAEGPGHVGRGVIKQIRSTDEGNTWSEPVTIFEDPEWDSRSHSTGVQLKSGTILLGFYRHDRKRGFPLARVLRSTDGGRTWTRGVAEALAQNRIFSLAPLADGRILAGSYTHMWIGDGDEWSMTTATRSGSKSSPTRRPCTSNTVTTLG